ncbi:MAG: hypothetical protein SF066_16280 [Thermoanaerobaculia bacterium]|nr:hypothetical protein [Thermoanaerobaculia bacterium]
MLHIVRTWNELTPAERDAVVAQYYGLGGAEGAAWERPILEIIRDLQLDAKDSDFTQFLPNLPSDIVCEVCGHPVALRPMSRTGLRAALRDSADGSLPSNVRSQLFPGQKRPVFYQSGRLAPCERCSHRPNHPNNCPCFRCKSEQRAAAKWDGDRARKANETFERTERQRALERTRARLEQRMAWHREAEIARKQFRVELTPQLAEYARALIQHAGRIESDGGLWLTLGPSGLLPVYQQLEFEPEPFDPWTVLAILQAAGILRLVNITLEYLRDENDYNHLEPVAVYVVTIEPSEALELGLIDPARYAEWDALDDAVLEWAMEERVDEKLPPN